MSAGVFLCGPTNSTMFTTCCEVAITDREPKCPACGNNVTPSRERWSQAYGPIKRKARWYGNWFPSHQPGQFTPTGEA